MKRILLTLALLLLASQAYGQTQTARFNIIWNAGAVLPDGSNAPTGFKLERSLGATGTFAQITQTGATTLTFADSIANDPGAVTYCYRVRAFNANGDSPYSNSACGMTPIIPKVPNAPSGLQVTALSATQVILIWRDNSSNEVGFQAERDGQIVREYAMNKTSGIDSGLTARTFYTYRVRALANAGTSAWSNAVKTKTLK